MSKLIHPELSYQVRGALLEVYNTLGPALKETFYRDAISIELSQRGIPSEREKAFQVYYQEEQVGLYYVDLWIDGGKILAELKVAPQIEPLHKAQAISYLKVTDADLAIVANYGNSSLEDIRLPNFLRERRNEFVWSDQKIWEDELYPVLLNALLRTCHLVHFRLGPGFLHQVYRRATMIELRHHRLNYEYIKHLSIRYKEQVLGEQNVRLILVEGKVALAAFAVKHSLTPLRAQLNVYLQQLQLPLGILANFYGKRPEIALVHNK